MFVLKFMETFFVPVKHACCVSPPPANIAFISRFNPPHRQLFAFQEYNAAHWAIHCMERSSVPTQTFSTQDALTAVVRGTK